MKIEKFLYKTHKELEVTDGYMLQDYGKYIKEFAAELDVGRKVALLYAGGPAIHHSDSRQIDGKSQSGSIVLKSQMGYSVYNIARMFDGISFDYVSINANTCASSMYCLYEANELLNKDFTDVIVVAMDKRDSVQELLFEQIGANVRCTDGFAIMHLKFGVGEITDVSWVFNLDKSCMAVSTEGYKKAISELECKDLDYVKLHGSGTEVNTMAELEALDGLDFYEVIEYKSKIGHTQGASTLIEVCMLMEDTTIKGNVLVLASGLGGFYGACTLKKE